MKTRAATRHRVAEVVGQLESWLEASGILGRVGDEGRLVGRPLTEESADCYPHLRSELKPEAAVPDPR